MFILKGLKHCPYVASEIRDTRIMILDELGSFRSVLVDSEHILPSEYLLVYNE